MSRYQNHITVALFIGLLAFVIIWGGGEDPTGHATVGHDGATFRLPVLGTEDHTGPQEHVGRVVLIDFWATYCAPCRDSMPTLQRIYDQYADEDFSLLSVNVDPTRRDTDRVTLIRSFQRSNHIDFPVLLDYGAASAAYNVTSIPHLVLLDRTGTVRFVHRRPVSEGDLRSEIDQLLASGRTEER